MLSSSSLPLLASCGNDPAKRWKFFKEIAQESFRRDFNRLSEEIRQEIFSRVPAKYVLTCRSACRLWKKLTSTQYFCELHHHRNGSSPDFTVLVEEMIRPVPVPDHVDVDFKVGKKLYIFEAWRGDKKVIKPRPRLGYYDRYEDIDGYEDDNDDLIIDDPIVDEEENIIKPRPDYSYIDAYKDEVDDEGESAMYISGSSSGLVVLHHKSLIDKSFSRKFIIMNPITRDKVTLRVADDSTIVGQIFGVFFHPVLKEFCVLWGQTRLGQQAADNNIIVKEYKLVNLGPSQPRWRNIKNQSTDHVLKNRQQPRIVLDKVGTVGVTSPIILDDVLYWMVEERTQSVRPNLPHKLCEGAILGFDTKTEQFHLLPHPSPCPCPNHKADGVSMVKERHRSMHLLENYNYNGGVRHLCLCQFDMENLMSIWMFQKEEIRNSAYARYHINRGSWINTHSIKLNHGVPNKSSHLLRPIAMVDEELVLVKLPELGYLFVLNLKLDTIQRFESKRGEKWNKTPVGGMSGTFMCAHTHTLMPIRNSKPEILLEEL